jgi:tetratricopeptide (TPR) repeat protein
MRDFASASAAGARAVELAPRRERYRTNYALYAMYASDFDKASNEAASIVRDAPEATYAYVPLAIGAVADGNADAARDAYSRMAKTGAVGASFANMGLADLAMLEGRYDAAEPLLMAGIREDERTRNAAMVSVKLAALAEVHWHRGRVPAAVSSARGALKATRDLAVVVPAARVLIATGRDGDARSVAAELGSSLDAQARAYGLLLLGEIAQRAGQLAGAVDSYRAALKQADLWLAHFLLGAAYVNAGRYPEALGELEASFKRRGEATALFLDDVPSYRYVAALPYWLGRARAGLGVASLAKTDFEQFLSIRAAATSDPLVADARTRLAALN